MANSMNIWVYAHWKGMDKPECIGILSAQRAKGRKSFSFSFDEDWLASNKELVKQ